MTALAPRIYLASRSPRRRDLLHQIHVSFELLVFRGGERTDPEFGEDALPDEPALDYVRRVARMKAVGGAERMCMRRLVHHPVLAADTTLELDGQIIGKPRDARDAAAILRRLSGRTHRVLTAVAIADDDRVEETLSASEVSFRELSEDDIRRYVLSGEPMDKAGAYGIQGRAALFVREIRGSYSGIMGLPLFETGVLLGRFGHVL
jgi:septum formation protein